MEETTNNGQELMGRLQVLHQLTARLSLASQMGMQYSGDRDIYSALGYPKDLTTAHYHTFYKRHDMAKAVINRPVKAAWRGGMVPVEVDDDKDTQFEKGWKDLLQNIKNLEQVLIRADRLTGLGRFGIILLGLDDIKGAEDYALAVKAGARKLVYVKAAGEINCNILKWETDTTNPRYGLPKIYGIEVEQEEGVSELRVHHSRVIHIIQDPLASEVYGSPRLEGVYNRLMDLEKLVGGSAEMFWRGARPGYAAKIDPEFTMTPKEEDDLKTMVDEYEHNLRRILVNQGVSLESLAQQVSDPKNHVDVQVQMISAETGIPKRILTGSERGELASSQDQDEWNSYIQDRRENFIEPSIIRPFIDKLVLYKILPPPVEEYSVNWEDLHATSDEDKARVGEIRAKALKAYASEPAAGMLIPPEAFYQHFLGLSADAVSLIMEMQAQALRDQEEEDLEEEETPIPEEEEEI